MINYLEEHECYKCGKVWPTAYQAISCCKSYASSAFYTCLTCKTRHTTPELASACCAAKILPE